jgi:glutamyl-Q tRNA(Asp) synthetase
MTRYVGRFAPSPSGTLHFGSLVAAIGSYLDARAHDGQWLVRIEDLDPPREQPGAADRILADLAALGLESDGPVLRQGSRAEAYEAALQRLAAAGALRQCACTRAALAKLPENQSRPAGAGDELFHPAECLPPTGTAVPGHALRLRVPAGTVVEFEDRSLGPQRVDVAASVGDFVLRRRDGLYAYQLAVVVDDAAQGVTDVVRGSDLLASTARQVLLQRALGLPLLRYMHLPLAVDGRGLKLSKSDGAPAARGREPARQLVTVLQFLGQSPPDALGRATLREAWDWARAHWRVGGFAGCVARPAPQEASAGTAG